jgi:hypothetical protein
MLANPPVSNTSEAAPEGVMEAKVVTGPKKAHSEGIRSKLSEEFDISKHKAQQLLDVERKSPDLLAQVSQGSIPLPQAVKMARASTSHKMTSSTKEPQIKNTFSKKSARAAKEARPLERLITRAVHAVEKILKLVPKDRQEKFRMEVAKAVRNLA